MRIPITPGDPIILPLRVSGPLGSREFEGILDTGSTFLTIPLEDAIDLGYDISHAPHAAVVTANGVIQSPKIILRDAAADGIVIDQVAGLEVVGAVENQAGALQQLGGVG